MKLLLAISTLILGMSAFARGSSTATYVCQPLHPHDGRVIREMPENVKHYVIYFQDGDAYLTYSTTLKPAKTPRKMKLVNKGITGQGAAYVLGGINVTVMDSVTISLVEDPDTSATCTTR